MAALRATNERGLQPATYHFLEHGDEGVLATGASSTPTGTGAGVSGDAMDVDDDNEAGVKVLVMPRQRDVAVVQRSYLFSCHRTSF